MRIYIDANAASPVLPEAQNKIRELLGLLGNPSSFHEHGRAVRAVLDRARDQIAASLNIKSKELIFSSGASESNRLIVDALILVAKRQNKRLKVCISPFEHPSMLRPILALADQGLIEIFILPLSPEGRLSCEADSPATAQLASCDVLIACAAHNETGLVLPLKQICEQVSEHCVVISDISQAWARVPDFYERADILSFSAQKMGGFAGAGGLVLRDRAASWQAPWPGGGQERGWRPGTENWLLISAMGEAASGLDRQRQNYARLAPQRELFEQNLLDTSLVKIIGKNLPAGARLPNTSAITFLNQDPDALRIALDLAGLSVGFGAACSGLAPEGSFALKALGLSLLEEKSTVRFSWCHNASPDDFLEALRRLKQLIKSH